MFCVCLCSCANFKITNISGETNYSIQNKHNLTTSLNTDYRLDLYEPRHKKWSTYIGGKVTPDYDHFGNEFKINVFTTIGVDF
jgi:hypothetical protein